MKNCLLKRISKLPAKPGVYFFKNSKGETIYIGKAINLKNRVKSYFQRINQLLPFTQKMVSEIKNIEIKVLHSEFEALLIEAKLINDQQPYYNIRSKDDKRFLMIAVSCDPYPRIYTVRRRQSLWRHEAGKKVAEEVYFGPFPSSSDVKMVLKTIRRIFPYCTCINAKRAKMNAKNAKACMYYHLGLCPGCCIGYPKIKYRRTIKKIIRLLNGDTKGLIRQLTKEMKTASKKQDFEGAAVIKKQIESLNYVTLNWQVLTNEGLALELGMDQLQQTFKEAKQILPQLTSLSRVECYDISNLYGKEATGSLVVFSNLIPDKNQYRKFRIRQLQSPDDTAMLYEVLNRRLNHPEWSYPDLIVVDGGKGQISGAFAALRNYQSTIIPLVGLTKKEETIIRPNITGFSIINFEEIRLPRNSSFLKLIQALRDESHRFAKKYHILLRKKKLINEGSS